MLLNLNSFYLSRPQSGRLSSFLWLFLFLLKPTPAWLQITQGAAGINGRILGANFLSFYRPKKSAPGAITSAELSMALF